MPVNASCVLESHIELTCLKDSRKVDACNSTAIGKNEQLEVTQGAGQRVLSLQQTKRK